MHKLLRILLLVLVLVVLTTSVALAASGEMVIPEWGAFLALVSGSGGLIAITLLDLLMYFTSDSIDEWLKPLKPYMAMLFSFLVPQITAWILQVHPVLTSWEKVWFAVFIAIGSYGVHEIIYRLIQKPAEAKELKLLPAR